MMTREQVEAKIMEHWRAYRNACLQGRLGAARYSLSEVDAYLEDWHKLANPGRPTAVAEHPLCKGRGSLTDGVDVAEPAP